MELREAQNGAEAISKKTTKLTDAERTRFNFLMSKISLLKSGQLDDSTRRAEARRIALEAGVHITDEPVTETGIEVRQQNKELRNYLREGREARTYSGMSVNVDAAGGYLVPAGYFRDKIFSSMKAADRLFDPQVVTFYESNDGNVLTVPMTSDVDTSAVVISENAESTEGELTTIDRLQLAKCPTWRSKQIVSSMELLQDSAFPVEDVVAENISRRFVRGIGASNVTTLLGAATSGATSGSATSVGIDDLYSLMESVDPAYLASPKCYWLMNFSTLISILRLKDSSGRYQIKPRTDANGNVLLLEKPVALCPTMPNVAASANSVALGDMGRFFVRTVKNTLKIMRYQETPGLVEYGLYAYEGFVRSNSGLLVPSGADSPIKYLTQAAS
jgi:HK97 family phage major capsid protein